MRRASRLAKRPATKFGVDGLLHQGCGRPACRRSPLLLMIMKTAAVERALEIGVPSKIAERLLPPSSMLNFFSPAARMMRLPVTVELERDGAYVSARNTAVPLRPLPVLCIDVEHALGSLAPAGQFGEAVDR